MAVRSEAVAVGAHDSWSPPGEHVSRPAPLRTQVAPHSNAGQPSGEGFSARLSPAGGLVDRLGAAHAAIGGLLLVVSRSLSLRRGQTRHLAACRVGQWVDGYSGPNGAPCSTACIDAGGAYALGMAALGLEVMGGEPS